MPLDLTLTSHHHHLDSCQKSRILCHVDTPFGCQHLGSFVLHFTHLQALLFSSGRVLALAWCKNSHNTAVGFPLSIPVLSWLLIVCQETAPIGTSKLQPSMGGCFVVRLQPAYEPESPPVCFASSRFRQSLDAYVPH